jgi:hypothetical protein
MSLKCRRGLVLEPNLHTRGGRRRWLSVCNGTKKQSSAKREREDDVGINIKGGPPSSLHSSWFRYKHPHHVCVRLSLARSACTYIYIGMCARGALHTCNFNKLVCLIWRPNRGAAHGKLLVGFSRRPPQEIKTRDDESDLFLRNFKEAHRAQDPGSALTV